ncbi:MAG: pitrilysin family protein [Pseudomonadota bacterium]
MHSMKPVWSQRLALCRWRGFGSLAAWAALVALLLAPLPSMAQTQQFTLANGLTLIVLPDRRAPTVLHSLWLRAGSMDEVDGLSGVAHVVEHMLFKGTPTVAEGEISRLVAAMGGSDNAFVSRDVTAYHQQVPAARLPDVMRLEADRFANNVWPDAAFQREMQVIKEERRQMVEESAQSRFFEVFMASAWLAHPYRRPIIGWMSDLQSLTPDDARAFFRQWYVPGNAAVVVVGDVDVAQVRAWAERYYGAIPARAVPERKPQTEPAQRGQRRIEYRGRTDRPLVVLGYRVPQLAHPDATDADSVDALALLLLAGVLDGHSAARLERQLVQGQGGRRLAVDVSASFQYLGRGPQLFLLLGTPADGVSPAELEAALQAEIARVAREGVSEAELRRVRNQWLAREVFGRDSLFAQARLLGSYWAQGWPSDSAERLQARLQAITPQQVQAVAARHFAAQQLTVGVLLPEVQP